MKPPFDIFREEAGGTVLWIGVAKSFELAEQRIAEEMRKIPGNYLMVSLKTGNRKTISPASPSHPGFRPA